MVIIQSSARYCNAFYDLLYEADDLYLCIDCTVGYAAVRSGTENSLMGTAIIIIIAAIVVISAVYVLLVWPGKPNPAFEQLRGYLFAHRGLHGFTGHSENSLPAFREAAAKGFGAELAVRMTRDGKLAVMHDESLERTAGVNVRLSGLSSQKLAEYRLFGGEHIPMLDEVLPVFEGGPPLMIEVKPSGKGVFAVCEALAAAMKDYRGLWCVESFDPRVVYWMRKHAPNVVRGQLSRRFGPPTPIRGPAAFLLALMPFNALTRPDFISYRFHDRRMLPFRLATARGGAGRVLWTIRSRTDLDTALSEDAIAIFEGFDPRS